MPSPEQDPRVLIHRHLSFGWAGLVCFLLFGLVLEGFHAFKSPLYLDVENETRRFLWRLAHAHGALLSILQMGVAYTFTWLSDQGRSDHGRSDRAHSEARFSSLCFLASLVLLPSGFFLAGLGAVAGDPGFGILLVPGGALCLLLGCAGLFRAVLKAK